MKCSVTCALFLFQTFYSFIHINGEQLNESNIGGKMDHKKTKLTKQTCSEN